MEQLVFNEKNHTYSLDGNVMPCVSDLCRFIKREVYADAPAWRVEEAALRGSVVHSAAESLDRTGSASIDEDYLPYLASYKDFLLSHDISWSLIEQPLYHPELLYAGTIDRYGLVDGKWTLIDLKTTYTIYKPLCRAQLNFYRMLLIARGLPVERMAILHLRKDKPPRLVTMPEDEQLCHALLTLHNALKKGKRRKD